MTSGSALRHPAFRALWAASTVSFIGTFVQDVAERWLVLDLTQAPMPVAMITTAFILGSLAAMLPAGVLADRVDRRRVVICSQAAQGAVATTIGLASWTGHISPAVLVAGAAALGLGMGFGSPAWSALIVDILPEDRVADAVTMNSIGFNIARVVGPAIGGVVLSAVGAPAAFLLNALTFGVVVVTLLAVRTPERPPLSRAPPPLVRAFLEPFGYAWRDRPLRSVLASMLAFTGSAAFLYALSPALARLTLNADAHIYGLMVGAMGIGAILVSVALGWLRARTTPRALLAMLMLVNGISALAISRATSTTTALVLFVPIGVGWTGAFSMLAALMQIWAPHRLRARLIALYTMTHFGMFGVASSVSGLLAEWQGVRASLVVGGLLTICAAAATIRMAMPSSFSGTRTR